MCKARTIKIAICTIATLSVCIAAILYTAYLYPVDTYNQIKKSDDKGITRLEALNEILLAFGANDNIFAYYTAISPQSLEYTPDLMFYDRTMTAEEWGILVLQPLLDDKGDKIIIYPDANNRFKEPSIRAEWFRNDYISVREVAVMIQSMFDADTIDTGYHYNLIKDSDEYKRVYKNAKRNGIITLSDAIYWSPIDTRISKSELSVLLERARERVKTAEIKNKEYLSKWYLMDASTRVQLNIPETYESFDDN